MNCRTDLIGKYLNFPDEEVSARIIMAVGKTLTVFFNYEEFDYWKDHIRTNPVKGVNCPEQVIKHFSLSDLNEEHVSKVPVYLKIVLANGETSGIMKVPDSCFINPLPNGSEQRSSEMSRTAAFDSEGELIEVYASGKAAKAAHKGASDVKYVAEDKFEPVGQYETAEQLFPPIVKEPKPVKEKVAKVNGEARTVTKREGPYTVIKKDGVRFPEGDQRGALHSVLVSSGSVEEYLEKAPPTATYDSTRGANHTISSTRWMAYAFKRGWIVPGEVAVEPAQAGD